MATNTKPFSVAANQKSGAKAAAISAASVVSVIGIARAFGFDLWPEENDLEMAAQITGAVSLVAYLVGIVKNWWTNRDRPAKKESLPLPLWLLLPIAAVALQGCAGLGGTTKYEMSFSDRQGVYDPATGEMTGETADTGFNVKASGKAGDVIQSVAKMGYTWDAEGGKISVASDSSLDSTARAEALTEFYAMQAQNFAQFTATLQMGMALAAPLVGQNLDLDAAQRQTDSANDFAIRQQLTGQLEGLFNQLKSTQDADRATLRELLQQMQLMRGDLDAVMNAQTEP